MNKSAQRIDYFILDLDGCVSDPFQSPDWALLSKLRQLSDLSYVDPNIPQLSICTGRPGPYTEAIGQWLNIQQPVIFEGGAGMLDLNTQNVKWNPALPSDAHSVVNIMMRHIQTLKQQYPEIQPETSKTLDAAFTCSDPAVIRQLLPDFQAFVKQYCPRLCVHTTDISISALWPQANKGSGLTWLCEEIQTSLANVAYIGDTGADIPAIEFAAIGFTPQNGTPANKAAADIVTAGYSTHGVLEAWHYLIEHNKRQIQLLHKQSETLIGLN